MTDQDELTAVLRSGARVRGLAGQDPVTIKSVERLTDDAFEVVYRDDHGRIAETLVYRENLPQLNVLAEGRTFSFDADGHSFRLAAEARRLRLAHLFDPHAALGTSDVDPLPHQLRAVYAEMLPRQPLRYVLADDPGAGKTIMAGLLVKELLLRGDASNVMIVAPGVLVDQWQDELSEKFGLTFNILTREQINAGGNPFERGGLWLCRLDVLARNSEQILDKACGIEWDLVIIDEAHKMSATVWAGEVNKTKRYQMGERIGASTRNLLLMTATPHSGKEEQFQLFMGLLDSDRFEGAPREGTRRVDVSDLMRRMVKEDLLTFEGTRLFPERRSYTVRYPLSDPEADLYADVTEYVRNQMNLADRLNTGDGRRRIAVGFALTTLQRRLASSPEAIYRSLDRRLNRLRKELNEARLGARAVGTDVAAVPKDLDDVEDLTDEERTQLEDDNLSSATAARSVAELATEVGILEDLVAQAQRVRSSPTYAKWDALRDTLDDDHQMRDASGARRKLIIFTEHKDTLDDLTTRLRQHLGRDDAVVTIYGGTRREDRKKAQETFRQDEQCVFLVATDAAGEGVNLQNAHLLINYDLPWNPNRIEQRFGRVHRIKQQNICHMWSLLAEGTREGDVFTRLLQKLDEQRAALGGRVFDVLGAVFDGKPLRDLMIDAIRYGDDPAQQQKLFEVVDATVGDGISDLLADEQLVPTSLDGGIVEEVRRQMERAEAVRLQPHHVEAFFVDAFTALGGSPRAREQHRYELRNVPARIRERDRVIGRGAPVVTSYHRITFDPATRRVAGHATQADLIHSGHPLMTAMISLIGDDHSDSLRRGAILGDPTDPSITPYLVCLLEHDIVDGRTGKDGQPLVISRRAQYLRLDADGTITALTQTPIPNLEPLAGERLDQASTVTREQGFNSSDVEQRLTRYASATVARDHAAEVTARSEERVNKTRRLVRERLTNAINYWDRRAAELREDERAGKQKKFSATQLQARADDLTRRLKDRMAELDREASINPRSPRITGACIVIPNGWFAAQEDHEAAAAYARETERVERAAVDATLAVERALGHSPREMARNNPGYDIESDTPAGMDFIEVKGRIAGADDFILTRQETVTLLNKGERAVLSLVEVRPDGSTTVRYIRQPVSTPADPRSNHINFKWAQFWNEGQEMQA
ncbi:helicase-related protein [Micromonospora wenchangensis]|uniref:helicase-related protein n=1 Tax=Micromonospora wenchangensis TaxID=1185415 RepID=UPI00342F2F57